jgi:cytochrome oxidase Cu insertion factor (SCO1/SenC/PrrC family)
MNKEFGRVGKSITVLALACIFCAELRCAQSIAGEFVFQSYNKPLPIPEFSLENSQGKIVNIENYRGQVLLLYFRATW